MSDEFKLNKAAVKGLKAFAFSFAFFLVFYIFGYDHHRDPASYMFTVPLGLAICVGVGTFLFNTIKEKLSQNNDDLD